MRCAIANDGADAKPHEFPGFRLYLVLVPFVEAAEQTIIRQVGPLHRQARVFGFAMAFEAAAAPITAFLIAPTAQVWIIPYAWSIEGAVQLGGNSPIGRIHNVNGEHLSGTLAAATRVH
jgi:hypothetical protein